MQADDLNPIWPEAVSEYLSISLPLAYDRQGWGHKCSLAFQMGCEALVKLGYAHETVWGAVPSDTPKFLRRCRGGTT